MELRRAFAALALAGSAICQTTIIRPARIDDVLVNPGTGIQTFQRFNGDPLNEGTRWSEEGPVAPIKKGATPDFPKSSIAYCRWFWETIEPAQGDRRWSILDRALEQAASHGQTLAIRLMPYDKQHPLPEWFRKSGSRRINAEGPVWEPDFADPLYLKHWGDLVRDAGKRYDGDPRLDSVDISSVGYWGEGWSDFMPAFQHQKALIDIWFAAFPSTQLLMNFDEPNGLRYGTSKGAGWRFDCLGDMRAGDFAHMLDFYPLQMVRAGIADVWQHAPVSFETCWVPEHWKQQGWDAKYILNEALRWHVSSLNVKSSAIPAEWKSLFDDFQRRMGYRFELRRIEYPTTTRPQSDIAISMWWVNAGVAPAYRPYVLALQLHGARDASIELPVDIRKWLPGDQLVEENVSIPDLPAGEYRVRVAMLDPRTRKPAIRFGTAGRGADGWYDLGGIVIRKL